MERTIRNYIVESIPPPELSEIIDLEEIYRPSPPRPLPYIPRDYPEYRRTIHENIAEYAEQVHEFNEEEKQQREEYKQQLREAITLSQAYEPIAHRAILLPNMENPDIPSSGQSLRFISQNLPAPATTTQQLSALDHQESEDEYMEVETLETRTHISATPTATVTPVPEGRIIPSFSYPPLPTGDIQQPIFNPVTYFICTAYSTFSIGIAIVPPEYLFPRENNPYQHWPLLMQFGSHLNRNYYNRTQPTHQ